MPLTIVQSSPVLTSSGPAWLVSTKANSPPSFSAIIPPSTASIAMRCCFRTSSSTESVNRASAPADRVFSIVYSTTHTARRRSQSGAPGIGSSSSGATNVRVR